MYETITAIRGGDQLYVVGGRSYTHENVTPSFRPLFWKTADTAEVYDLHTNKWSVMRSPLSSRAAVAVTNYKRLGGNYEPNLLLVGGERHIYQSGRAYDLIEEYDVERDLYYCHQQRLPHSYYGGAIGVHEGNLHIVGGAEWFGISASRRVQVYNIQKAPPPRPCFYEMTPVFDNWRHGYTVNATPYPEINRPDWFTDITKTQYGWREAR